MRFPVRCAPALALALSGTPVLAQAPQQPSPPHGYEIEVRERWIHGRQRPEFTPWNPPDPSLWLYIDSIGAGPIPGARRLRVSVGGPGSPHHAVIVHDPVGRIQDVVGHAPAPFAEFAGVVSRMGGSRFDSFPHSVVGHPAVAAPELIPAIPPASPAAGVEWFDSIRIVGPEQTITGFRRSRIEGDTVIAGRRHWIVRNVAEVELVQRWEERERTLDTLVKGGAPAL